MTPTTPAPRRRPHPLARLLWWTHVGVVVFVVAYIAVSSRHTADASIGFGLGLFALGGTGLPWSLPVVADAGLSLDTSRYVLVAAGGTLLNLSLHAGLQRWLRRLWSNGGRPRRGRE